MAILHRLGQTDLRRTKPGMYGDGGGLWLQVTKGYAGHANRSWIFRYGRNGKRREMGLGPIHIVGLRDAREKAAALRKQVFEGIDPIEQRNAERAVQAAATARAVSFDECAAAYAKSHGPKWTAKHASQWAVSLAKHASPGFRQAAGAGDRHRTSRQGTRKDLARQAGNSIAHAPAYRGGTGLGHCARLSHRRKSGTLERLPAKAFAVAARTIADRTFCGTALSRRARPDGDAARAQRRQRASTRISDIDGEPQRGGARGAVGGDRHPAKSGRSPASV